VKQYFLIAILAFGLTGQANAQRNFGTPENMPSEPVTVAIPDIEPNNGPGPAYNSALGQWHGHDMAHYNYVADEYIISGNADGEPYKTRLVVRRPQDMSRFSGLVLLEPMHPAGFAHGFEHNSVYLMDAGHIAVEVLTMGQDHLAFNPARYGDHHFEPRQTTEVLAQAGALIKSASSPIAGEGLRKMILFGTSATSAMLTRYLPAHDIFMQANGEGRSRPYDLRSFRH